MKTKRAFWNYYEAKKALRERKEESMNFRNALVRATRTALQTLAASIIAFPTASSVVDIKQIGEPMILALYTTAIAFAVTFLQNAVEESAGNPVPK